ncbi:PAS domain S-box protein [Desulfococcus sp.]|uniref:PAS domain S-box protein n=1 Tax=Desulfococcus sp. TaxID=2025834 RepID=UPI003D0A62A0
MAILAIIIKRFERQRTENLRSLEESNRRLNTEIAEREKAQNALKASEALFRNIFRTSPEAIVISRLSDGLILDVNDGFNALTGYPKPAVVGKTAEEIQLWKDPRNRKTFVENLNRYGSVRNLATQFITRDGSVRSVLLSSKIVPLQNGPHILTVTRDITEIKEAEARLKKSEEKFRSFFEAAADLIHLLDEHGHILMTNPTTLERLQYNEDQMLGRKLSDFMSIRSAEAFQRHFQSILSRGFHRGEYELITSSGAVVSVDASASVIHGDNGEPLHIITFQKDITDRKLAARKLEASHTFLLIANRHSEMTPVLEAFMKEIEKLTRCQAVAVRILNDNGSAPYAASFGFDADFCVLEKTDPGGAMGASRNVGICRHMLNGTLGSVLPCFTKYGSFHSNQAGKFWGSMARYEKDSKKNICNQVGFESLALIPIRSGETIIGLIHVADRQRDKISPATVEILEGAAMQLGSAIQRIRAEEALKAAYDVLEKNVQERTEELRKTNSQLQQEIEKHRKTEQALLQYQTQLRTLSAELLKTGEQERRRIAAEIHDRIGQTLAITKIQLGALRACLSDRKILMSVDAVRDLVSQTIKDTRSLTFELSPPILYELGLVAALEWLAETLRKQSGFVVHVKPENCDETRIDNTIRELLFRTIRELLLNVVKHAQAHQAIVSIYILSDHVTVVVRDDGVGFSPDTLNAEDVTSRGFGLFSIREQLNHYGGRSTIEASPGAGTQVTIELPLTENGISLNAKD